MAGRLATVLFVTWAGVAGGVLAVVPGMWLGILATSAAADAYCAIESDGCTHVMLAVVAVPVLILTVLAGAVAAGLGIRRVVRPPPA